MKRLLTHSITVIFSLSHTHIDPSSCLSPSFKFTTELPECDERCLQSSSFITLHKGHILSLLSGHSLKVTSPKTPNLFTFIFYNLLYKLMHLKYTKTIKKKRSKNIILTPREKHFCCLVAKLHLTLCDPMNCSPPGSSAHGISQTGILEWIAISFSRGSSRPRDWTQASCIVRRILYH